MSLTETAGKTLYHINTQSMCAFFDDFMLYYYKIGKVSADPTLYVPLALVFVKKCLKVQDLQKYYICLYMVFVNIL